jgi:hypothetical protein
MSATLGNGSRCMIASVTNQARSPIHQQAKAKERRRQAAVLVCRASLRAAIVATSPMRTGARSWTKVCALSLPQPR